MSTKTRDDNIDQQLLRALGHPLRQRILRALNEGVASPNQLAERLGEPLGNVSYHVKILADCQAIELVKTEPRRGAVEHFYRAMARPHLDEQSWAKLPTSARRALADQTLQQIWDHVAEAAAHDGFLGSKTHVSWTTLQLDDQAYAELTQVLDELLERAMDLQAEAAARLAESEDGDRDEHRTELALMHFQRGPSAQRRSTGKRRRSTSRKSRS